MNLTISSGNMTRDPEITMTTTGKKKAEFTLALNRWKEGADFPRFIAWEESADIVEKYTHKGSKVLVEGHIRTGSYDGKNGKVYTTDVIVDRIELLDRKPADGTEGQPKSNPNDGFMKIPEGMDEEMPFS